MIFSSNFLKKFFLISFFGFIILFRSPATYGNINENISYDQINNKIFNHLEAEPALQELLTLLDQKKYEKALQLTQLQDYRRYSSVVLWIYLEHFSTKKKSSIRPADYIQFYYIHKNFYPFSSHFLLKIEEALIAQNNTSHIINFFSSNAPVTLEGHIAYIQALITKEQPNQAHEHIRSTWQSIPFSSAEEEVFLNLFKDALSAYDHEKRMHLLIDTRDKQAKNLFKDLPSGAIAAYNFRIKLKNFKSLAEAQAHWEKIPFKHQNFSKLYLKYTQWLRRNHHYSQYYSLLMKKSFDKFDSLQWNHERSYGARLYMKNKDPQRAYNILMKPSKKYISSDNLWLAGFIATDLMNKPKKGEDIFTDFTANVSSPISKSRGYFWLGRAQEKNNNPIEAKKSYTKARQYSNTFYSIFSHEKERNLLNNNDTFHQDLNDLSFNALNAGSIDHLFPKLELMRLIDSNFFYAFKLLHQGNFTAQKKIFLTKTLLQNNSTSKINLILHLSSITTDVTYTTRLSRLSYTKKNHTLRDQAFPQIETPKKLPVEKALILAIIRQESNFSQYARSHANALGLMQILPKTAKATAKSMKVAYNHKRLTQDPKYNILIGANYMKAMLNFHNGSYILAIASYNAGPKNVKKWIQDYGDPRSQEVDAIFWIENIPFKETRNYVQRVLENLYVYRSILNTNTTSIAKDLL